MEYKNIDCSSINPFKEANLTVKYAKIVEKIMLRKQPITADVLFLLKPPTRYIVIAVDNKHTNIVAKVGLIPNNIIGLSK